MKTKSARGICERCGVEEGRPHALARSGNVVGALDLHPSSAPTDAAIRLTPSLMVSSPVAYERRRWASEPKSTPATVAMRASSSRKAQTSAEPLSVPPFQRFPKSHSKALEQFHTGSLLAVHTRNFLNPADPPVADVFGYRGIRVRHERVSWSRFHRHYTARKGVRVGMRREA